MRKAQIHFSNSIEELVKVLKQRLFPEKSHPFDQRMIIIPHPHFKTFLMHSLVKDDRIQIAAGIKIVSLYQAIEKITKKTLPNKTVLSLFIEYHLLPLIPQYKELQEYFDHPAIENRIGPFCDQLSSFFSEHGIYGNTTLQPWQEHLWQAIKKIGVFPSEFSQLPYTYPGQIHVFGFSYLPSTYVDFFHSLQAQMYFFSPCLVFWGDFFSEKKKIFLKKTLPKNSQEEFLQSFNEQNFLLAHWGELAQKMHIEIEEKNLLTEEYYVENFLPTSLHRLQRSMLYGESSKEIFDETVQFYSAPSKLREIEALKEKLIHLMTEQSIAPCEMQIFAPDIDAYASSIHFVFGQIDPILPYSISGLEFQKEDLCAQAFSLLLHLPKNRFSFETMCSFLQSLPVKEKLGLSKEDLYFFQHWMSIANVQWGISAEQRSLLLEKEMITSFSNSLIGTWKSGFLRLILAMGQIEGEHFPLSIIETSQIPLLEKFFQIVQKLEMDLLPLVKPTFKTIPEWFEIVLKLLQEYISLDFSQDLYSDFFHLLQETKKWNERTISWTSFERIVYQVLQKKNSLYKAPHLQAIQFSSLGQGCSTPCRFIHVLGLQESAFPRKEIHPFFPTNKTKKDHLVFLELISNAKSSFSLSFQTAEEKNPSSLISQVLSQGENGSIYENKSTSFDPTYFLERQNSIPFYFQAAKAFIHPKKTSPLIPEFYFPHTLSFPMLTNPLTIEFRALAKLAKHPLRFYFHEILKIYPEYKEKPYLLSPWIKQKLVKESLGNSFEKVMKKAESIGELPKNAFQSMLRLQIQEEVEKWQECLHHLSFSAKDLYSIELSPFCKAPKKGLQGTLIYPAPCIKIDNQEITIVGRIDNWTAKGLLVKRGETLENIFVHWPHLLISHHLKLGPIVFLEEHTSFSLDFPENALQDYLRYFLLASSHASPFIPDFGKALLKGDIEDLQKALNNVFNDADEIFAWLNQRDSKPNAKVIYQNWNELLKKVFIDLTC